MPFFSKIFPLLFVAIVLVSGNDEEDPHRAAREKCGKELGYTEDVLKMGKDNPESYKCYLYCFLKELNIMDAFGNFYPETAVSAINEDLRNASRPGIFKCYERTEGGNELCEHAYDVIKCFAEDSPEIYQLLGIFTEPQKQTQEQQEPKQQHQQHQQHQ